MPAASESVFTFGYPRGVSFVLRADAAASAVDSVLALAAEEGFVARDPSAINATLSAEGSAWRIAYTEVGDVASSWLSTVTNEFVPFLSGFRQKLAPLVLVVGIRNVAHGVEVAISPLPSLRGAPDAASAGTPRVNRIIERFRGVFASVIVSESEPFRFYPEVDAPVFSKKFRKLSGWR